MAIKDVSGILIKSNQVVAGETYGRSTRRLKAVSTRVSPLFLCLIPHPIFAQSPAPENVKFIFPALAAIFIGLIAHVVAPMVRDWNEKRRGTNAYFVFIITSIKQSEKLYGREVSEHFAARYFMDGEHPDWLTVLKEQGSGVPEILWVIQESLDRYLNDSGEHRYVPLISYGGMPVSELNHEHPIWTLNKVESSLVSDYLLSQQQAERTSQRLYTEEYLRLARSPERKRNEQWYAAGQRVLLDLAMHYVNTQKLSLYVQMQKPKIYKSVMQHRD